MGNAVIFLFSYHHNNTKKICTAIAAKINAKIIDIGCDNNTIDMETFDVFGFGSGIDSGKHYPQLIDFAKKIPNVKNKKAFIFSTSGIYSAKKMQNDHKTLRNILESKGFEILGEFGCKGYNTNSILKRFGGMNKGRPNTEDIKNAEAFAEKLLEATTQP